MKPSPNTDDVQLSDITIYNYHAMPLTLVKRNPQLSNWHIDKFLNICQMIVSSKERIHLGEFTTGDDFVVDFTTREHLYSNVLQQIGVLPSQLPDPANIISAIDDGLAQGWSIIARLDHASISQFLTSTPFIHEVMITGFSDGGGYEGVGFANGRGFGATFQRAEIENSYRIMREMEAAGRYAFPNPLHGQFCIKYMKVRDFKEAYQPQSETVVTNFRNFINSTCSYDDDYSGNSWYASSAPRTFGVAAAHTIIDQIERHGLSRKAQVQGADFRHIALMAKHQELCLRAAVFFLKEEAAASFLHDFNVRLKRMKKISFEAYYYYNNDNSEKVVLDIPKKVADMREATHVHCVMLNEMANRIAEKTT